jgi:apolipoprotein N-acyltransferase
MSQRNERAHYRNPTVSALRTGWTGLAAGGLCALSLPPWGFWPLAAAGIALLDRLIADQPAAARFWRGFLVGLALLGPSLWWMKDVTVPGYLIAVVFYGAMIGGAAAVCPPGRWRRLALPGAWLLAEAWRMSWPFGRRPPASVGCWWWEVWSSRSGWR